ncbi:chaperone protein dnaJ 11, chloroplastic [Juglans microcarpa x Juglans regia]|uniref:chaperone protein dnaJ 11, chloroplastic n=1 Tax=Juglans microcarpa x Juglans regia TaxID=2249226 RepID=UPI001B7E7756|nr:chaperone protein dnaJ 11, chloroplastic [Juglans microcarpa x Juglans regia]
MLSAPSPKFLTAPNFSAKASTRFRFAPPLAFAATSSESRSTTSYMATACTSLYEILGIHTDATCQEIKTAYRRLARTCHPDVVAVPARKDSSAGEFMRIHAAYSTLSDPHKRADYDRKLFRPYKPLTATSGFSGYSRKNWETDQCW